MAIDPFAALFDGGAYLLQIVIWNKAAKAEQVLAGNARRGGLRKGPSEFQHLPLLIVGQPVELFEDLAL
jgi:hypothetical protein